MLHVLDRQDYAFRLPASMGRGPDLTVSMAILLLPSSKGWTIKPDDLSFIEEMEQVVGASK